MKINREGQRNGAAPPCFLQVCLAGVRFLWTILRILRLQLQLIRNRGDQLRVFVQQICDLGRRHPAV